VKGFYIVRPSNAKWLYTVEKSTELGEIKENTKPFSLSDLGKNLSQYRYPGQ